MLYVTQSNKIKWFNGNGETQAKKKMSGNYSKQNSMYHVTDVEDETVTLSHWGLNLPHNR